MALTEKGRHALELAIDKYNEGEWFSAKELSDKCGEKIVAATLTAVCNNGYMEKQAGSPVKYSLIKDAAELLKLEPEQVKKGANKENLDAAKKAKDDEFYTRYEDVEAEVIKYKKQFKGKTILLPCDDHGIDRDNFWRFFVNNFDAFQLKKLIAVHFSDGNNSLHEPAYKIWIDKDINGDGFIDEGDAQLEYLQSNGDFRSEECTKLLEESDIVITNPPFSLFKEFVPWIMNHHKDFLIIGPLNAMTYQEIFPYFRDNQMWAGYNNVKHFGRGGSETQDLGNVLWYTNLSNAKRTDPLIMTASYYDEKKRKEDYPKCDNTDIIFIGKVVNIPNDYYGLMAVPISFIQGKHNSDQFDLIGVMSSTKITDTNFGYPYINGQKKYARLIIKRK